MLNNYINLSIVLLFILSGSVSISNNQDECVFDSNYITDDFLKENKNNMN